MVLAVHAQLSRAAAAGHDDVLKRSGLYEGCRFHDGVGGTRTETSGIGTGGVRKARDLGSRLCEVAAAPLVHIAAGFFAAVDHVIHIRGVDPGVIQQMKHGQDFGSFGDQILEHDVCRKVNVHVVGPLYVAYGLILEDEGFRVLFFDRPLDIRCVVPFLDEVQDGLLHQRMLLQLRQGLRHEFLVQTDEIEDVACLHQQDEFVFGHDLTEFSETFGFFDLLIRPGFGNGSQFFDRKIADICLVWRVRHAVRIGPHMGRKFLQIIRSGIDDLFRRLCRTVVHYHARNVDQDISCSFDHTVAHIPVPFKKQQRRTGIVPRPPLGLLSQDRLKLVSDGVHLAADIIHIEYHLHHRDLFVIDVRIEFSFDFGFTYVITSESQRDSRQRTGKRRIAKRYGFCCQTCRFSFGCA